MNVSGASKGLVYGSLSFIEENRLVDCGVDSGSTNPTLIPKRVQNIRIKESRAELILVVEKETVFQKLIHDQIRNYLPELILITGKGYPDYNTRSFIQTLSKTLKLCVFYLGDWDAFGIDILLTYQFGSQSCALEGRSLVLPHIHWIGPFYEDFNQKGSQTLSSKDRAKLEDIRSKEFFILKNWNQHPSKESQAIIIRGLEIVKGEVTRMMQSEEKYEVQALALIKPTYLTTWWLPSALKRSAQL